MNDSEQVHYTFIIHFSCVYLAVLFHRVQTNISHCMIQFDCNLYNFQLAFYKYKVMYLIFSSYVVMSHVQHWVLVTYEVSSADASCYLPPTDLSCGLMTAGSRIFPTPFSAWGFSSWWEK